MEYPFGATTIMDGGGGEHPAHAAEMFDSSEFDQDLFHGLNFIDDPGLGVGFHMASLSDAGSAADGPPRQPVAGILPHTPQPSLDRIPLPGLVGGPDPATITITGDHDRSRVETQIKITLCLDNISPAIRTLRLPRHTIAKPKFLHKEPVRPTDEMLQLYASLVCKTPMETDETLMQLAMRRAAEAEHPPRDVETPQPATSTRNGAAGRSSGTSSAAAASVEDGRGDGSHHSSPSPSAEAARPFGGIAYYPQAGDEVRICQQCVMRERKRAARKKAREKNADVDLAWSADERRRIIVFNTKEVVDLTRLAGPAGAGAGRATVELPMRIACYCRHHNEQAGFYVIFTVKDHQGRLVTQGRSPPFWITDDYKEGGKKNGMMGPDDWESAMTTRESSMAPTEFMAPSPAGSHFSGFDILGSQQPSSVPLDLLTPRSSTSSSSSAVVRHHQHHHHKSAAAIGYHHSATMSLSNLPSAAAVEDPSLPPRKRQRRLSAHSASGERQGKRSRPNLHLPLSLQMTPLHMHQQQNQQQNQQHHQQHHLHTQQQHHTQHHHTHHPKVHHEMGMATPHPFVTSPSDYSSCPPSSFSAAFLSPHISQPPTPGMYDPSDQAFHAAAGDPYCLSADPTSLTSFPRHSSAPVSPIDAHHSIRLQMQHRQSSWLSTASASGSAPPQPHIPGAAVAAYPTRLQAAAARPRPIITDVVPDAGPAAGVTKIAILGENFTSSMNVYFGDLAASQVEFRNEHTIIAYTPVCATPGTINITLGLDGMDICDVADEKRLVFGSQFTLTE